MMLVVKCPACGGFVTVEPVVDRSSKEEATIRWVFDLRAGLSS